MILQALASYYRRLSEEAGAEVAPEGFEKKEIPFAVSPKKSLMTSYGGIIRIRLKGRS